MDERESAFNPGADILSQIAISCFPLLKPPIAGATEKLLYHGTEVPAIRLAPSNDHDQSGFHEEWDVNLPARAGTSQSLR